MRIQNISGGAALALWLAAGFLAGGVQSRSSAAAGDWPRWRGPELNGVSREKGWSTDWPKDGPTPVWRAAVGTGFCSVAVSQGRVFTLGNSNETDTVWCLGAADGRVVWKHSFPCPLEPQYYEGGPHATPTVDRDRVFTLSKRGQLFCFKSANGELVWQKDLMAELGVKKPRWGFAGSPLIEKDLLVLNVGGAGTAVDKNTGKVVWTSNADPAGYATPVPFSFAGERGFLIFSAKALVAVKARTGQELWRFKWETKWDLNTADPIVSGDKVFISTFDRGCALLQLGANPPSLVWQSKNMANHFNSCVLVDGCLYGIDGNSDAPPKDLRCVELATGRIRWQQTGFGLGSLLVAGSKLIVLSDKGELAAAPVSKEGFKPEAQAQVLGGKCWTTPVLANGLLYCRNAQGALVCLDLRAARQR